MMKKTLPLNYMTFEDVLKDPSLSSFHEVVHFLEEKKDTILFPEKFMATLKDILARKIRRILSETPDMPLIKVVITSLTGVNENIEPEMLLEITAFIIKEWEGLTVSKQEKVSEFQFAIIS
jgi:hypothetical protein